MRDCAIAEVESQEQGEEIGKIHRKDVIARENHRNDLPVLEATEEGASVTCGVHYRITCFFLQSALGFIMKFFLNLLILFHVLRI